MLRRTWLSLLTLLLLTGVGFAHPIDEWFVDFQWTDGEGLKGQLRVPQDQWEGLQANPILFKTESGPVPAEFRQSGADDATRVIVEVSGPASGPAESLTVELPQGLLDDNQNLVGFLKFGDTEPLTILIPAHSSKTIARPAEQKHDFSKAVGSFFQFGIQHIVEGYDHLLFLFCLLIPGGTLRHFLVVVTAFTVGHSLTLGASVLGYISLPSELTEAIIAFSIVVAALFNLRLLKDRDEGSEPPVLSRGLMAGGFGLIHGLGFAGLLMDVGIKGTGALAPLLGFNLGVEAGQLVIVAVFFPILMAIYKWKHRTPVLVGSSLLAAAIGFYWFLERVGVV